MEVQKLETGQKKISLDLSLLLPVHNEADTIERVITEFYNEICEKIPTEIIVAEDGSTDGTKGVLRDLAKKIPMKLILGEERRGYSRGIIDGLNKVNTKFVAFVDSDGQYAASDFWKLYDLREKYDIISGQRAHRADGFHRKLMSASFQWMTKLLFRLPKLNDITTPYRFMRSNAAKEIANEFKYMEESFWTEFTIRASRNGFRFVETPVTHRKRLRGNTNVYKLDKLFGIVFSQLKGILLLWKEFRSKRVKSARMQGTGKWEDTGSR